MGDLEADTAVEAMGDGGGRFRATLSEDWRIWGPNGGYLASIALRAAGAASSQPRPASIAVHFLGVADFGPVDLQVSALRSARRAESLRVSMSQAGKPVIEALVWAVADGIEPLDHLHAVMPEVPPADDVPTMEERMASVGRGSPFKFWDNIDNRGLQWRPDWPPPGPLDPEARWWCRYRPRATFADRWVDAARALLLVDTFGWPAASGAHAWRTTTAGGEQQVIAPTMDVHATFHAFEPDEPWLLVDGVSPSGGDGLLGARVSVWSASGRLLASGGQTMLVTRVAG